MEYPLLNQQQLAMKLKKTQSNKSEGLKRGGYEEIQNMFAVYNNQIAESDSIYFKTPAGTPHGRFYFATRALGYS